MSDEFLNSSIITLVSGVMKLLESGNLSTYEDCLETFSTFKITCPHDRTAMSGRWRILAVAFVSVSSLYFV